MVVFQHPDQHKCITLFQISSWQSQSNALLSYQHQQVKKANFTFFSAGEKESVVEEGTSTVTPPSTTSFSLDAARASCAACVA